MSDAAIKILELMRRVLARVGVNGRQYYATRDWSCDILQANAANEAIKSLLETGRPAMVARFGVGELQATIRYACIQRNNFSVLKYLLGRGEPGWWTADIRQGMPVYNGFFPTTSENLNRFGERMLADMAWLDILGCWQQQEAYFAKELRHVQKVRLRDLEPYFHHDPWSRVLEGKKVLVVHPFAGSIQQQFQNRERLFSDARILPPFELKTIRAVQTIARTSAGYSSWFDALADMEQQVAATDFDIAIIGCGAYGFPLAAFVKRLGKQAVHLGGATQILFGIRGRRWDEMPEFQALYNEYWIRPLPEETPEGALLVEGACYW